MALKNFLTLPHTLLSTCNSLLSFIELPTRVMNSHAIPTTLSSQFHSSPPESGFLPSTPWQPLCDEPWPPCGQTHQLSVFSYSIPAMLRLPFPPEILSSLGFQDAKNLWFPILLAATYQFFFGGSSASSKPLNTGNLPLPLDFSSLHTLPRWPRPDPQQGRDRSHACCTLSYLYLV